MASVPSLSSSTSLVRLPVLSHYNRRGLTLLPFLLGKLPPPPLFFVLLWCPRVGVSRCGPAAVVGRGISCFVGVNLSSSSHATKHALRCAEALAAYIPGVCLSMSSIISLSPSHAFPNDVLKPSRSASSPLEKPRSKLANPLKNPAKFDRVC